MNWSKAWPLESGYWWMKPPGQLPEMVLLLPEYTDFVVVRYFGSKDQREHLLINSDTFRDRGYEWCGPMPAPPGYEGTGLYPTRHDIGVFDSRLVSRL